MNPVILFVTYTMNQPAPVGGAFFRALRLAVEFHNRGWIPIICNRGPSLNDPKIDQARAKIQFIDLDVKIPGCDSKAAYVFFKSLKPDIVVFGEGPLESMQIYYDGARMINRPFVLLDQYYSRWLVKRRRHVDLLLLNGLKSFWKDEGELYPREVIIPPHIEAVTPKTSIPVPPHLHAKPWVTLIAYDSLVLQKGIQLLAHLENIDEEVVCITVSHEPGEAEQLMFSAGMNSQRLVHLPLQNDANVYGLMEVSQVLLISNGFLQIMEALALATPVICISRGIGITAFNIDERFKPFVSIDEDENCQVQRLKQWLTHSNSLFPPALREELKLERNGVKICTDLIEEVKRQPPLLPRLRRLALHFGVEMY